MEYLIPIISFFKVKTSRDVALFLPEEVMLNEILPKLPAKSLLRFKCVSKKWLDHISNNDAFIEAHRRHHHHHRSANDEISSIVLSKKEDEEIDYRKRHKMFLIRGVDRRSRRIDATTRPKVEDLEMSYLLSNEIPELCKEINVLGSSNGLVLLSKSYVISHADLVLWNPTTREFRDLPRPILVSVDSYRVVSFYPVILDLGFDEETRDHKVVKLFETINWGGNSITDKHLLNFQVFSKKSDSWSKFKPFSGYRLRNSKLGVSLNGDFYFLASQVTSRPRQNKCVILSFRYRSEEVQNPIEVPHYEDGDFRWSEFELLRWKEDSLALISRNLWPQNCYDFWVMVKNNNNNNNNGFYWCRVFRFDYRYPICGIWRSRFMIIQRPSRRRIELSLWDPKGNGKRRALSLKKLDPLWHFSVAINYVPSLVSVYPEARN